MPGKAEGCKAERKRGLRWGMATATKRFSFQVTEGRLVIQVDFLRHEMKCLPKLIYIYLFEL